MTYTPFSPPPGALILHLAHGIPAGEVLDVKAEPALFFSVARMVLPATEMSPEELGRRPSTRSTTSLRETRRNVRVTTVLLPTAS